MQTSKKFVYHNLDMRIGKWDEDGYLLHASSSECGEEEDGKLQFPYTSLDELRCRIDMLHEMQQRPLVKLDDIRFVEQFGKDLFTALFAGDMRHLYEKCKVTARNINNTGLRIRLHISEPELAVVPWEYLYDATEGRFLAAYSSTPIVRYMDIQQSNVQPSVKLPLKLLCMISSPTDLPLLNVQREKELIEKALKPLAHVIHITWFDAGQLYDDLQHAMRTEQWHIFHFIGHGGFDIEASEGYLCFADHMGDTHKVSASDLAPLLDYQRRSLRLVFLNTCESGMSNRQDIFSSLVGGLMQRGILSVVAMQQKITDSAAVRFSYTFYSAIADGLPIEASVAEARIALKVNSRKTLGWGIPVLYMRAKDGSLFKFQKIASGPNVACGTEASATHSQRVPTKRRRKTRTTKKDQVQTLKSVNYNLASSSFKKSLPHTHWKVYFSNFAEFMFLPIIQDYLENYISFRKINRCSRGKKYVFALLVFLALDVVCNTYCIDNIFHTPVITALAAVVLLLNLLLININEHVVVGILCSFVPSIFWTMFGITYFHILPILAILINLFIVFLRFLTFKPRGWKRR